MGKGNFFSKKKQAISKAPKEKKGRQKTYKLPTEQKKKLVSRSFWAIILLVFGLMIFFVLRSFGYSVQQNKQAKQLARIEETLAKMGEDSKVTDNLDVFCRQFISVYYSTNRENQETYKKSVSPYFSEGIELPKISLKQPEKKPVSLQLWKKEAQDDQRFSIAYLVTYSYGQGKTASTGKELIHFVVEQKKNKYAVVVYPYFEAVPTLTNPGIKKQTLREKDKENKLPEEETKPYEKWLTTTFFPKYFANTPLEEMKYMMQEPAVLGNVRTFEGISTIEAFSEGNQVSVYVNVKTLDPITKAKQDQEMKLTITRQKDQTYQVDKLTYF